jgi:hypothetical protein
LIRAAASIGKRKFLMVGRRWNVDITEPWDFSDPQWRERLVALTRDHGVLFHDYAIDYFVFSRDSKLTIQLPFAVGRPRWDNYFLFRCRQLGYPLIDATTVVTAVHQNHDYAHLPKGDSAIFGGPEADANIKLLGDKSRHFSLLYATHELTQFGLRKIGGIKNLRWRLLAYLALHPRQKVLAKAILRRLGLLPLPQDAPSQNERLRD